MAAPSSPALHTAPIHMGPSSRQQEQIRRFLYPSLSSTDTLPRLLPLSEIQDADVAWIQLDLKCQLLLAQILRIAIQPWYSKLTNDRQLIEEVVGVVKYALHRVKDALLQRTGNMTRLEHILLHDLSTLIRTHYSEVRRATAKSAHHEEDTGAAPAALILLASNPHPALSISGQSQLVVDEAYLDLLLLAILQGALPSDHFESNNETLVVIDVVKGIFRGQVRVHCSGAWVIVRALLMIIETQACQTQESFSLSTSKVRKRWYRGSHLLFGLNLVHAVIKTLFFYVVVLYLDLFTPVAEPKKRTRRRKVAETDSAMGWSLDPALDTLAEALQWRSRLTTRFIEGWLRMALTWGGSHLIERQVKESITWYAQPEQIKLYVARLLDVLVAMPQQPPPEPVPEPSLTIQRQELDRLVTNLLAQTQLYNPIALLLGHDESTQRQSIEGILLPFLAPPLDPNHSSVVQVANATMLLALLECFALLVNPALKK